MNRAQLLTMLSSAGAFAGCAGSGMTRLPWSDKKSDARSVWIDVVRQSVHFPTARPDGAPVASHANYAATVRKTATILPQAIQPCTQDVCGGGGGDFGGPQPDLQFDSGAETGYYWDSENYVETWTQDGSTLLSQATWAYNASGNTLGLTFTNCNGYSVTATGPSWYNDGTYSINGGLATLVVSAATGRVSLYHSTGLSFTGVSDCR
jgi:hypothetical protein